jgi:hypothetical protein
MCFCLGLPSMRTASTRIALRRARLSPRSRCQSSRALDLYSCQRTNMIRSVVHQIMHCNPFDTLRARPQPTPPRHRHGRLHLILMGVFSFVARTCKRQDLRMSAAALRATAPTRHRRRWPEMLFARCEQLFFPWRACEATCRRQHRRLACFASVDTVRGSNSVWSWLSNSSSWTLLRTLLRPYRLLSAGCEPR